MREQLRRLLREKAILRAGEGQPIGSPTATSGPWMFYSWDVTLTAEGARLAGACVLEALQEFRGTRLATVGYTAMPILSACLLLGEGRYSGLCVREARKPHSSYRRIDGPRDGQGPVVVLDDSISTGSAVLHAITALEEEGFEVEGCVSLVHFPYRGGVEKLRGMGYRVVSLFDMYADLEFPAEPCEPEYRRHLPDSWGEALAEGLDPGTAARQAALHFLETGRVPRPPARLDADYAAPGGTFVSFRHRVSDVRHHRDGFWHFEPEHADPCRDLVLATVAAVRRGRITAAMLADLKICVTFFGPLESVPPGHLDFSRYGVVVRSRVFPWRMGGALPNTQHFTSETEQYHHARVTNARIGLYEPHDVLRHTLTKHVEPDQYWLPYGAPSPTLSLEVGEVLTRRARQLVRGEPGEPVDDDLVDVPVSCLAVTLYQEGIAGCGLSWSGSLEECLGEATRRAVEEARERGQADLRDASVSVSVLHDREWLGEQTLEWTAFKLRGGLDSLTVQQGERRALFLPVVPVYFNLTTRETCQALMRKAGIAGPPCSWAIHATETWLSQSNGRVVPVRFGFVDRRETEPPPWTEDLSLLAGYVARHCGDPPIPAYRYDPVRNERQVTGSGPRRLHALGALWSAGQLLQRADWCDLARAGLLSARDDGLPREDPHPIGDAILLDGLCLAGLDPGDLAERVASWVRPDGRVALREHSPGIEQDHDFLPGSTLLALSRLSGKAPSADFYRRRFAMTHSWAMVGWHPRVWNEWHARTHASELAEFVFEMADWALDFQLHNGSFITDMGPEGYSFHAAFLAEGLAAAWAVARRVGDEARRQRYRASVTGALRFMNQLIYREEDTFCCPYPELVVGGVRGSPHQAHIRIDFVSHTMVALASAIGNARLDGERTGP